MLNVFLFLLIGFAGPFLLWPIEVYLPHPALIEEIFKLLCIWWIYNTELSNSETPIKFSQIKYALLFGFLFSLTESILYLFNISLLNSFNLFPKRLLWAGVMHTITAATLMLGVKYNKITLISSLLIAIGIHQLYNSFISFLL